MWILLIPIKRSIIAQFNCSSSMLFISLYFRIFSTLDCVSYHFVDKTSFRVHVMRKFWWSREKRTTRGWIASSHFTVRVSVPFPSKRRKAKFWWLRTESCLLCLFFSLEFKKGQRKLTRFWLSSIFNGQLIHFTKKSFIVASLNVFQFWKWQEEKSLLSEEEEGMLHFYFIHTNIFSWTTI